MSFNLVSVYNLTANGAIQEVDIPNGAISVMIKGRSADVLMYGSIAGTEYFTISSGDNLVIDTHNMGSCSLYLKATNGVVIELLYQMRR